MRHNRGEIVQPANFDLGVRPIAVEPEASGRLTGKGALYETYFGAARTNVEMVNDLKLRHSTDPRGFRCTQTVGKRLRLGFRGKYDHRAFLVICSDREHMPRFDTKSRRDRQHAVSYHSRYMARAALLCTANSRAYAPGLAGRHPKASNGCPCASATAWQLPGFRRYWGKSSPPSRH